jgi:MerR family transcriptional regulator, light-induced transcriptional regulator
MNGFTIKDLENLSGIKAHTIRIWEQRYSFLKPQRTQTNIRYYTNDELKTILNISLLNKYGFKISHIDRMGPEQMRDKILSLNNSEAQQERVMNDMLGRMVDLDTDEFERIIDNYILARGIERTITQLIFPFLERIGVLWQTDHINPAQEHLVTNIIRHKLIVGIEATVSHTKINKTVLLFLPEKEHHELGLLFMYYLLKSRGVKVIYLGANVPVKDAVFILNHKKPDIAYVHLTSTAGNFNFEKFLDDISSRFEKGTLIVSGNITQSYKKKLQANIEFKKSLSEVMEFISTL